MKGMVIGAIAAVVLLGLIVAAWRTSRAGYESAPYSLVRADGPFELRDYPALAVVETPMAAGVRDGADGGFGRLFRFITGANQSRQSIAMTTPVFMSGGDAGATMAFVMPAKMTIGEVPKPADASVAVRQLPAGRFAVLRGSGGRNAKNEVDSLARLQEWMRAQQLAASSLPVYAYFDPPWTPGFLRRNEVMLRLAETPASAPAGPTRAP